MPSCYAHKKMGAKVYRNLPTELRQLVRQYLPYFLIGLHGPDLLFYHGFGLGKDVSGYGRRLHREEFEAFYENARMVIRNSEDDRQLVYFYGVLCHLYLDNLCHTYLKDACEEYDMSHGKLEMEFERYLLNKDGQDPMTYPVAAHIGIHPEYAHVIAPFYLGISEEDIMLCLMCMRGTFSATRTESSLTRKGLCKMIHLVGGEKKVAGLVMSRQASQICRTAMKHMETLMDDAAFLAREAIVGFLDNLYREDENPEYTRMKYSGC